MNNNKDFVLNGLKALEENGKFREIKWLTESYFCGEKIEGMLKDGNGNSYTVLIHVPCELDKDAVRKDANGYDRYYSEPISLNGTEYLVYNHWVDNSRADFQNWLKDVIGNNDN